MKRDRKAYTNRHHKECALSAPSLRFVRYHLFCDFLCIPDTDRPSERLILRYTMENPDQTIARVKTQRELQLIKALIEAGSVEPTYVYDYQGLILEAEYEVVDPNSGDSETPRTRKIRILDGYPITENELREKFDLEISFTASTNP